MVDGAPRARRRGRRGGLIATSPPAHAHPDLEAATAREVLEYALKTWHPRLAVACSFQKEASVIVDLVKSIEPEARIFTLDTGVLFEETHDTWRRVEQRYGTRVEVYRGISLAEQAERHGDALWAYVAEHDLPYNVLHDRGYASIGCTHCTRPGSGREGRWAGDAKLECGLHAPPS